LLVFFDSPPPPAVPGPLSSSLPLLLPFEILEEVVEVDDDDDVEDEVIVYRFPRLVRFPDFCPDFCPDF